MKLAAVTHSCRGQRGRLVTSSPENAAVHEARIQAAAERVQRELAEHPEQERESLRHRRRGKLKEP